MRWLITAPGVEDEGLHNEDSSVDLFNDTEAELFANLDKRVNDGKQN